jgi:hypothetical protein
MQETETVLPAVEGSHPSEITPFEPSRRSLQSRIEKSLGGILAAIVTVYGVLMALVIFAASQAQDLYYDNVFIAQAQLSDASELALEAHINVLHDLSVLEQIQTLERSDSDPELIKFLHGHLSAEAQASLERSGDVDDAYADEVYAAHNVEREMAMMSFDLAAAWSERSGIYETITTVLAVGLAFAAWASLLEKAYNVRWMFAIISALILAGSLGFLAVNLVTREPLEQYVSYTADAGQVASQGKYIHPSGAFEFVIPAGWDLVEQDEMSVLISDGQSAAGVEFAAAEREYTEDEVRAYATEYVDANLEGCQIDVLDVQHELMYARASFDSDGTAHTADFFFDQEDTIIFIFFFATPSDTYDETLPTRDEILDTFQGYPDAVRAANP